MSLCQCSHCLKRVWFCSLFSHYVTPIFLSCLHCIPYSINLPRQERRAERQVRHKPEERNKLSSISQEQQFGRPHPPSHRLSSTNQPWNAAKMTRSTMKVPTLLILSKSRNLVYLVPKSQYLSGIGILTLGTASPRALG